MQPMMSEFSYVIKRDGRKEKWMLSKIENRISKLADGLNVEIVDIISKALPGFKSQMSTFSIDESIAEKAAELIPRHPDYSVLASRIAISNLQKSTYDCFSKKVAALRNYVNDLGRENPLVTDEFADYVERNKEWIDPLIDYEMDYNFDYFGFKTLRDRYLLKMEGKLVERPQDMFMRIAVALWMGLKREEEMIEKVYTSLARGEYIHATPTLFNAGTYLGSLSSCFLMTVDDSVDGFGTAWKQAALISKHA